MPEFIYQMHDARKAHGSKVILDEVTLSFYPGAKIGVVGPNGMGKSTLLKIMAGLEDVSNGEARLTPGFTVGILQQEPELEEDKTVIENVRLAFGDMLAKIERFNQVSAEMADPDADFDALMEEMGKLQDEIDAGDGWDLDSQLTQAMDALQLPDPEAPVNVLSGGERRRVALCRLLLEAPDLLLLDEPTNHLDAESVLWLEQFLKRYEGAVLAVTHDRYFLDNVAEWICEVDRGHLYPYKGNYSTYLETKAARLEAQGQQEAKLAKKLERELEWVRSSPKARQAKSKARLERYEQMDAEARSMKKVDFTDIHIPPGPRLGNKVLIADHLSKSFGDRVLIDDLSFELPRNGIVGIIGPNGAGKTTIFNVISSSSASSASRSRARVRSTSARRSRSPTSTRTVPASTPTSRYGRSCRMASTSCRWGRPRCPVAPTWPALVSRARTRASPPACSRVASATASISHLRSSRAATCSCSTSRPMTWIPRRWRVSRKPCSRFRVARSSRATTAGSSTGSQRISSPGRVRRRILAHGTGSRVTLTRTRRIASSAWARLPRGRIRCTGSSRETRCKRTNRVVKE